MKSNKNIRQIIIGILVIFFLFSSFTSMAVVTYDKNIESNRASPFGNSESLPYNGHLRIYVVEIESRWNMYGDGPYHYALMGFAYDDALSIDYLDTHEDTITWNGDVTEDNVIVMAAIFNPEAHFKYSYPQQNKYPFDAYFVDAAAGVLPGDIGYNVVNEDFSHTVFIEEATGSWCPYCPAMANALYSVYQSGDYPFYFVALVEDENSDARKRLNELNVHAFPTAMFDGGRIILVGGYSDEGTYRSRIESLGGEDVHELNLTLSVEWLGGGNLRINFSITNMEVMNPPETPGPPSGVTNGSAAIEYTYTASTIDPEGNKIFYLFDWGDGTDSGWVGPYSSGANGIAKHMWTEEGDYEVRVKAKDTGGGGYESDWSPLLPVHMEPQLFEIEIFGGISGVSANITNVGKEDYPDVKWSISAVGGLLGLIDVSGEGSIWKLTVGEILTIETDGKIFGLGKIDITVTAGTIETMVQTAKGFVLGPLVLVSEAKQ